MLIPTNFQKPLEKQVDSRGAWIAIFIQNKQFQPFLGSYP